MTKKTDLRKNKWKIRFKEIGSNLTVDELDAFIPVNILSGYLNDNKKTTKFLFGKHGYKLYRLVFNRKRFDNILNSIKFDKSVRDKTIKIERKTIKRYQ